MEDPKLRSIPPFDHGASRQVWIGWGTCLVFVAIAPFVGGSFWPFLFLSAGVVAVLRGHFPRWFHVQREAQVLAGIPARTEISLWAWVSAAALAIIFSAGASALYRKFVPEKPDAVKVLQDGFADLKKDLIAELRAKPSGDPPAARRSPGPPRTDSKAADPPKPITAPVITIEPHYGAIRGTMDHKFKLILDNIGLTDISHIDIYEHYFLLIHINPLEFQNAASFGDVPDSSIPFLASKHSVPFEVSTKE